MATITKNINLLYAIRLLQGFMFFLPIFALLLEAKLSSVFLVTVIMSIQALLIVILEVPSGAVSDAFGRKRTIVAATLFLTLALPFLYFGTNFFILIGYIVFNAIGRSLFSGTDSSILYESEPKDFKKSVGILGSLWPLGAIIGALIGGVLATKSLELTVLVTIIPFASTIILSLFLQEPKKHKKKESIMHHMKSAITHIKKNKTLQLLMLLSLLFFACGEVAHQLDPLFFAEKNIPLVFFGVLATMIYGFSFLGNIISHKITDRIGDKKTMFLTIIIPPLLLVGAVFTEHILSGVLITLGSFFWGIRQPVLTHHYHLLANNEQRATIVSIGNLVNELGFALAAPIFGYFVDIISLFDVFLLIALVYVPILIINARIKCL